jgi:selenocysteine-specific elongation factor
VRVLDETGEIGAGARGLVQLRLESPIIALHDDRFVIRSYSPQQTIGGGVVLHPFAVKHRSKELAKTRQLLRALMEADRASKFRAFVDFAGEGGHRLEDVGAATGWTDEVLQAVAAEARSNSDLTDAGGVFLSSVHYDTYARRVKDELEKFHKRDPLAKGFLRETLREKIFAHSAPEIFTSVLATLESQNVLVSNKDTVRASSHSVDLSDQDRELKESFESVYKTAGVEAPSVEELMTRAGVASSGRQHARKILQLLIDGGTVIRIQGEMMMHSAAVENLKRKLVEYGATKEPDRLIDVATFKEIAGVSRKYAIPLLEYFDLVRVTRRAGDKRIILK